MPCDGPVRVPPPDIGRPFLLIAQRAVWPLARAGDHVLVEPEREQLTLLRQLARTGDNYSLLARALAAGELESPTLAAETALVRLAYFASISAPHQDPTGEKRGLR